MKLVLVMILCILPCWAFDADDYISKLYKPMPAELQALETRVFDQASYQREISPWLNDLEFKLSRAGLSNIDASFLLLIDKQGRIVNLELDDAQVEPAALRDFISKLASLEFEPSPLVNTRLLLDAKTLTISRNEKLEAHRDTLMADFDLLSKHNLALNISGKSNLTSDANNLSLKSNHTYEATLISPEFFSAARVGDTINFELESQQYVGRVIDTGREIIIATDALLIANEIQADTLQYWRLEQRNDSGTWDSMIAGATSAGLGLGLASQGLGTGIFAGLAALATRVQDADISLNLGDKFSLRKLDVNDLSGSLPNRPEQGLRVRGSGVDSSVNEHAEDERNAVMGDLAMRAL